MDDWTARIKAATFYPQRASPAVATISSRFLLLTTDFSREGVRAPIILMRLFPVAGRPSRGKEGAGRKNHALSTTMARQGGRRADRSGLAGKAIDSLIKMTPIDAPLSFNAPRGDR